MKRQGFYPVSPYKQPLPQFQPQQILHGLDEEVDYLPGTHIRVWFTHLPTAYPPHRHDCLEIIEGIHSHYTCQIGEQTYTVAPEDILLIPPGTVHDLTPAANCNGWIYLCGLSWVHSIPTSRGLQPVLSQPTFVSRLTQPTLYMTLAGHLSHMRSVYFSADSDRELLFDAELLLMLSGLRAAFASTGEIGPLDKRRVHEALFRQVVEFIELNYARDLTLDSVAHHFNLSNAYFSRLFAQYVHESFSDYLTHRRMKEAERLLAEGSLSITEVALRCGYSSPAAFSRAFQARQKCTPSQFRHTYLRSMGSAQLEDI